VNAAWRALGAEHNQTQKRSEELFNDWGLRNEPKVDLAKELLAEVTRDSAMVTKRELRAKSYELSAGVGRPADADRLVDDLARTGELLQLQDGTWTTRHLREQEKATLEIAERRAGEHAAPVGEQALKQARREIGREIKGSLTQEQREALDTITGPGGVSVLVGRAGTGKGVTIAAAARAWQLEGNEVIGTAIAGATAQRLKDDAKLDRSYTADGLLSGVENGHIRLGSNTIVVMDESGMSDSDRLSRLVKMTGECEARDVQIDTDQFSDLSLAYAVHVHKGQGLTTETSGILTGAWQTDRERTYVAVSRAREQTQIYLAREDLGQQGLDTDAIERLAERMQQSRAQEATITKQIADQSPKRTPDQAPERTPEQISQRQQQTEPAPQDPQIRERDLGEMIREQQERQRDWEQGIDPDRNNDRGYGIE